MYLYRRRLRGQEGTNPRSYLAAKSQARVNPPLAYTHCAHDVLLIYYSDFSLICHALITLNFSDVNEDWTCKDKDKDKDQAYKDQDKDKD